MKPEIPPAWMYESSATEATGEREPDDAVMTIAVDTRVKYLHGDLFG